MRILTMLALAMALAVAGCDDDDGGSAAPAGPGPAGEPRTESPLPDGHVPIVPADDGAGGEAGEAREGEGEAAGGGEGEGEGEGEPADPEALGGRAARRLTVDALRRSIPALFGGITWTIELRRGGQVQEISMFDALARTLGEPDYIEVTEENGEPSPLFAKFMDDMAGAVCREAVDRDGAGGPDGLVVRHPDDPDANLRFLRLKLHAIHVPDGDTDGIAELRGLYDGLLEDTNDPGEAWYGVCVAMVTAPEFMAF